MAQHVHRHIHLLINLLLTQFLGELSCQLVGFIDVLLVHQEHDLIAALGVIAVHIVFLEQIVLECL